MTADCPLAPSWAAALLALSYLASCTGLLLSALVRVTRTDDRTDWRVRWAFVGLGGAGLVGAGNVLLLGRVPDWTDALLALAILAVQAVAERLWGRGVPAGYVAQHSRL